MISACYSGGFIPALEDDYTLIMTAARKDRKSFGCSDDSDMTFFGKALVNHALPETSSLDEAFNAARDQIKEWEKERDYEHSLPQIHRPKAIINYLKEWREQLTSLKNPKHFPLQEQPQ